MQNVQWFIQKSSNQDTKNLKFRDNFWNALQLILGTHILF